MRQPWYELQNNSLATQRADATKPFGLTSTELSSMNDRFSNVNGGNMRQVIQNDY
jgi:hypothetical protein